jgi:hypothetical protein
MNFMFQRLCHDSGGQSADFKRGGPGSISGQSIYLWLKSGTRAGFSLGTFPYQYHSIKAAYSHS